MADETKPTDAKADPTEIRKQAVAKYFDALNRGERAEAKAINDKFKLQFSEGQHS